MKTLIIIPAYNEEANIERVVNNLIENFPQYDYVVINDGSKDSTGSICRKNGYNLVDLPVNLGLSGGFQAGMKYAHYNGYDFAIQFDGDGQHNPEYIEKMLEKIQNENLDIVIGSRFVDEEKPKTARMFGNNIIEFAVKATTGVKINDTTSGMRMFNKKMIDFLSDSVDCGPEPDTLAYLIRCGAKVGEVQVQMSERIAGESYLTLSRSVKYMTRMCMSIVFFQWFRKKIAIKRR